LIERPDLVKPSKILSQPSDSRRERITAESRIDASPSVARDSASSTRPVDVSSICSKEFRLIPDREICFSAERLLNRGNRFASQ